MGVRGSICPLEIPVGAATSDGGISFIFGPVADNIRFGPQLKGKNLTDGEVYKLLSLADLDSSFYKKTNNELSVGQTQGVALARTLAIEPGVMPIEMYVKSWRFE
ncbi:hypothetical protein SADUNF_Sadunf06G0052700 [Salix dunnii]|uniref:ABC transporter domain-containing protein n=1 Tax=Salix dunnii TaxID=1413687 RepID=A0A835K7H5_9ROSI|nr:hypothetical protein SADUNF_Sadunf06G0052700 [Salix dunnii]